jgi:hypothetical protein
MTYKTQASTQEKQQSLLAKWNLGYMLVSWENIEGYADCMMVKKGCKMGR